MSTEDEKRRPRHRDAASKMSPRQERHRVQHALPKRPASTPPVGEPLGMEAAEAWWEHHYRKEQNVPPGEAARRGPPVRTIVEVDLRGVGNRWGDVEGERERDYKIARALSGLEQLPAGTIVRLHVGDLMPPPGAFAPLTVKASIELIGTDPAYLALWEAEARQ